MITIGYLEEIFERLERSVDVRDATSISEWLRKDRSGQIVRKETVGISRISRDLAYPFEVRKKIEKAQTLSQISEVKRDIGAIEMSNAQLEVNTEFRRKQSEILERLQEARREETKRRIESRREEALTGISREFILRRGYRNVSAFSKEYDLSQTEAENRLRELGFDVQENRIIR